MTIDRDSQEKENSGPTVADKALALELLQDLDLDAASVVDLVMSPALRAVDAAQAKRHSKQVSPSDKQSAKDERLIYKLNRQESGLGEPRPYNRNAIAPRQLHETEAEYKRRYNREYVRIRRGVTAEDIEAREFNREVATLEDTKHKKTDAEAERRKGVPVKEQSAARADRRRREKDRAKAEADAALAARKIF